MLAERINTEQLETASELLRSLAHPIRIAIIQMLSINSRMSVTQIFERLNIEQPKASHHLNILKLKGILQGNKRGKHTYYSINESRLELILGVVELLKK